MFETGAEGEPAGEEGRSPRLIIPRNLPADIGRLAVAAGRSVLSTKEASRAIETILCAPLTYKERFVGIAMVMNDSADRQFSPADERLIQAIAKDMALAIVNAELSQDAEQAMVLIEADKIKSQFISAVSYELRTPLTSIKGCTTSLLRQDVDWDNTIRRDFLKTIDERTDELQNLIDKMLQIAKLEAGALKLEKEPLSLPRLAQKVLQDMRSRTTSHQLMAEFPSPFPIVEADSRCVEQVLKNLVENAIKYSPSGGQVRVSGTVADGSVVISVADEGIGVPPEQLDRIFDRFYRVESPHTQRIGGTGLGLSIARGLVEAHGGRIWAESHGSGGSTFHFELPQSPSLKDDE